jgi:hypothetical protein
MIDYVKMALDAGYEPWGGGDVAPADWDHTDDVILRNGDYGDGVCVTDWRHSNEQWDIIGYRKRAEQAADTVTVPILTLQEVEDARVAYFNDNNRGESSALFYARRWGLLREETRAERFTRETGFEVTDAVEAALEWERK